MHAVGVRRAARCPLDGSHLEGTDLAGELRLGVVDDDEWKRSAMAERLDSTREIAVVFAVDQDVAAEWPHDRFDGVDAVLVDVFDDKAPGERGTDLYSGIKVVERLARHRIKTIAVTPSCAHPLVQLRMAQAHPDRVYHRWEVPDLEALASAVLDPAKGNRMPPMDRRELRSLNCSRLLANDAVRSYEASMLYGHIEPDMGIKHFARIGISTRQLNNLKDAFIGHGFGERGLDDRGEPFRDPRWPDVLETCLRLLGRLDAPPTEFDKPWW